VTDVPWLIALPFRLKQGIVVDSLARNVDIWPTLLDLAGLPPLPDADGRSLVPAIVAAARGEPSGEAPPAYGYLDRNWGQADQEPAPILSVREGDRRLVLRTAPERELLLFDVAADPTEQRNLVGQRDDWVQELLPGLKRSLDAPVAWAVPEVELDEMSREVLRALGYVVK
jgi:arylsulfatase A-like enzyme